MKLREWITSCGGPCAAAKILKVGAPTVRMWLYAKATPRPITMCKIFNASRGEVTFETMVLETCKVRVRKRK